MARRVDTTKLLEHLGKGEPVRDLLAAREAPRQILVVDGGDRLAALLGFIALDEARASRRPGEALERDHGDADLALVAREQLVGSVGRVEARDTGAGGARVVGADDEVGAAVVAPDDGMPERLARSGHARGERQQRQRGEAVGIVASERLIAFHAGEMIEVPRPAGADARMDQNMRLGALGRLQRDLALEAVHRTPGMKADHAPPAEPGEEMAQILGRVAQRLVAVMSGQLDALQRAADVPGPGLMTQIGYPGMGVVLGGVHQPRLAGLVRLPHVVHGEHGEHETLAVAHREPRALRDRRGGRLVDVEGDRDRPHAAVGEAPVLDDAIVGGVIHEACERREGAVHEQLEVAELTLIERDRGQLERFALEDRGARLVHQQGCELVVGPGSGQVRRPPAYSGACGRL